MLVTRRQAEKRLRRETGRSLEWCHAVALRIATVADGRRMKILKHRLDEAIRDANLPPEKLPPIGIRPLSDRKIRKVRSYA